MPLPRRPNQRSRALVASAYRVGDRDSDYARRRNMPWQQRALETVKLVPELNFASRFYARMLKQLRIYPAEITAQEQQKELKSGPAVEILSRIRDPGGGRSQLLFSYGRLMFITGEGLLFGRNLNSESERWSFIWNGELDIDYDSLGRPTKYTHKLSGSEKREYGPNDAVAYRMWTPSPLSSYEAESPMQAGLEIAEELIILTKSVRSTAVSRLVKGLLFMPAEISPPPEEPLGDEDPLNDPWSADWLEAAETQIEEPGTARGAMPLISWVAGEHIDSIRFIQVHDPQTDYMEQNLRKEAIDRLAWGMDMPPEALKGLGDSNHWAAMQILGDMWKSHGAPVAEQFCDELSSAYLQPALRDAGVANWQNIVVAYDASQVVVKPDRSDDADKAADRGFISPRGYRILKNIPEEYAPSPEELEMMREFKRGPAQPRDQQLNGDPAQNGPPQPGSEGDSGRRTRVVTSSAEALGAASMALARCRELAGVRLRNKAKACPECISKANGSPHALIASVIGPENVEGLGVTPPMLVRGGADTLYTMLLYWGYSETQAKAVCELIEGFAAKTLFTERQPPLPAGFAAHLEQARGD